MRIVIAGLFICVGVALMVYIPLVYMLYGGVMQAVDNWGIDNSAVVTGIIRAVLCEFGVLPGGLLLIFGTGMID